MMNLEQALNFGGNLMESLADAAWAGLLFESTAVVVYAQAQMLLSQALPELEAAEAALLEATGAVKAAQAKRDRANEAWRKVRYQPDVDLATVDESQVAGLRAAWQDAEVALSQAQGRQLPLAERRDRLATLVHVLSKVEKPETPNLSILVNEVQ